MAENQDAHLMLLAKRTGYVIILIIQIIERNRIMGRFLVTGITFGVFMTEALIHYNMGMAKSEGEFKLRLPPARELAKIAAVTGTFSVLSGVLIDALQRRVATRL